MIVKHLQTTAVTIMLVLSLLSGCSGDLRHMQVVAAEDFPQAPSPGKTLVIFMRPSNRGHATQSSLFDVTQGDPELIGLLPAGNKVALELDPGRRVFMVIGENANFMPAELAADKTYYALVTVGLIAGKTGFSLTPVRANELASEAFDDWYTGCESIEKKDSAAEWMQTNRISVLAKQRRYYPMWMELPENERHGLSPLDGR